MKGNIYNVKIPEKLHKEWEEFTEKFNLSYCETGEYETE